MCTTISFKYNKGYVFGRTLEMGIALDHDIMYLPAKHPNFINAEDGMLESKYAVLGTAFKGYESFGDGINEKGLMGSNNFFPGFGSFATEPSSGKLNIILAEAFDYLLSYCSDVQEVIEKSSGLWIRQDYATQPQYRSVSNHFFFKDAMGRSVVLEPVGGRLEVFDNPYGVLTNAPSFDWHSTNLRNYIHLTPSNIDLKSMQGVEVEKLGEGTGMLGIPGDFTPPSRFIRAAYFVAETKEDYNREKALLQGFRILSQFDIPKGAVVDKQRGHQDETIYTSMMDTKEKTYSIKCQNNINIQTFKMTNFKDVDTITRVQLNKEMSF